MEQVSQKMEQASGTADQASGTAEQVSRNRLRAADVGVYAVVIVVAILAWTVQSHWTRQVEDQLASQGGIYGAVSEQMDGYHAKRLDAFLNSDQQVTTMGTALLGGVFYLLFSGGKAFAGTRRKWAVVVGAILVSVSVFFGFVASSFVIATLGDGLPDPIKGNAYTAEQTHFYTFLLGVVFFADFIFHNLPGEEKT